MRFTIPPLAWSLAPTPPHATQLRFHPGPPLQVLGTGELHAPLTIKAAAFSASAKAKIEAAGGQAVELPQKPTWTRQLHEARVAAAN